MPLPNLNDWTARLDVTCRDALGETIQFKPRNGGYETVAAHVNYREAERPLGVAQTIAQDILVALVKTDITDKPCSHCRVKLSNLPGKVFRPANVRDSEGEDQSGTHWYFDVETVSG